MQVLLQHYHKSILTEALLLPASRSYNLDPDRLSGLQTDHSNQCVNLLMHIINNCMADSALKNAV